MSITDGDIPVPKERLILQRVCPLSFAEEAGALPGAGGRSFL
ncbi:MAG: hypothetical protein ACOY3J_06855 [Bacillota bacterium]|nr:hypothetical protein [Thermanaerosceptrum fracticalcis]